MFQPASRRQLPPRVGCQPQAEFCCFSLHFALFRLRLHSLFPRFFVDFRCFLCCCQTCFLVLGWGDIRQVGLQGDLDSPRWLCLSTADHPGRGALLFQPASRRQLPPRLTCHLQANFRRDFSIFFPRLPDALGGWFRVRCRGRRARHSVRSPLPFSRHLGIRHVLDASQGFDVFVYVVKILDGVSEACLELF